MKVNERFVTILAIILVLFISLILCPTGFLLAAGAFCVGMLVLGTIVGILNLVNVIRRL